MCGSGGALMDRSYGVLERVGLPLKGHTGVFLLVKRQKIKVINYHLMSK